MEPDPREPTGDLGYDMAHVDMAREGTGGPSPSSATPPGSSRAEDTDGDYGYDEAHDFRR